MKKNPKKQNRKKSKNSIPVIKKKSSSSNVIFENVSSLDIFNCTKKTVLHSAPRWALSTRSQAKGFMFEKPSNNAIIFVFKPAQKVSLHMWFVFGQIDVIGLDEHGVVLVLKERFKPWAFWSSQVPVTYILEVPAGTILATKTAIGDTICLPSLPSK